MQKRVEILGGGTFSYVRNHLAICAPAFGETAYKISCLFHHDGIFNQYISEQDMLNLTVS